MTINLPSYMRPIAGMWPKTSKHGNKYFVGGNGRQKVWLFHNPDASEDEAPWTLFTEIDDDTEVEVDDVPENWKVSQLVKPRGKTAP